MKKYIKLLSENEQKLMAGILEYAKLFNFAKYTSTLLEAWQLSIQGLTNSIILAVEKYKKNIPELNPDEDYRDDPLCEFGIEEAKLHRHRGITLSMFLGLMKYYKQTYCDLIKESDFSVNEKKFYLLYTERCFDRIEIAFCVKWTQKNNNDFVKELQNSNRKMTNEKNKYLTIFESSHSPIFLLDNNNTIINYNNSAASLFVPKNTPGEAYYNKKKAKKVFKIMKLKLLNFLCTEKEEIGFEIELDTTCGKRIFSVRLKKMLDVSEKFNGSVLIFNDITEHIEMEEKLKKSKKIAEQASLLKSQFIANLSHEIRTPMNGIIGFTQLLNRKNLREEQKEKYHKLIEYSGDTLLKLIEDIIDISKIDAGQLKIEKKEILIHSILTELYETHNQEITKQKKEIKLSLTKTKSDIYILSDNFRLKQVLNNLIGNAIKYTQRGEIKFGYKINNNKITFFVKDTGVGISEKEQQIIFKRFTRVGSEYSHSQRGTGLGLAISREMIKLLGSEIKLKTKLNEGSTFYFSLPIIYQ